MGFTSLGSTTGPSSFVNAAQFAQWLGESSAPLAIDNYSGWNGHGYLTPPTLGRRAPSRPTRLA